MTNEEKLKKQLQITTLAIKNLFRRKVGSADDSKA